MVFYKWYQLFFFNFMCTTFFAIEVPTGWLHNWYLVKCTNIDQLELTHRFCLQQIVFATVLCNTYLTISCMTVFFWLNKKASLCILLKKKDLQNLSRIRHFFGQSHICVVQPSHFYIWLLLGNIPNNKSLNTTVIYILFLKTQLDFPS